MALTKQQKMDMIYDVELRLAKEELAEQHLRNIKAIEDSEKPLRTLKNIMGHDTPPVVEVEKMHVVAGQALSEHQRDEWHDLSERHFEELKAISVNVDAHDLVEKQQAELKQLLTHHSHDRGRVEQSETPLEEEQAILMSYQNTPDQKSMAQMKQQDANHLSSEERELMEQSEEATKTPFEKSGLDSKTKWEFIGLQTLAMREAGNRGSNIQKDFENAKGMSNDHDMGMER